jgi:hypothetical protein
VIAVHDNFPEKSASVGEHGTYNTLKICDLSSISFPKKCLLGRVDPLFVFSRYSALTVNFPVFAARGPITKTFSLSTYLALI